MAGRAFGGRVYVRFTCLGYRRHWVPRPLGQKARARA